MSILKNRSEYLEMIEACQQSFNRSGLYVAISVFCNCIVLYRTEFRMINMKHSFLYYISHSFVTDILQYLI